MMLNKKNLRLAISFFTVIGIFSLINPSQAQVTGAPGYTSVNSPTVGIYDITNTATTITSTSGRTYLINRYTQFSLPNPADTANVYLNGADASLNIVNGPASNIYGTINSLSGTASLPGSIAGDLIFINPAGIIMWAGSSINAGSILLSTSSSSNIPLGPGASTYADLNDSTQDAVLFAQGINDSGVVRFTSPTSTIDIMGAVNANNTRGVTMFADSISIGTTGGVTVPAGGSVGLYTGNDFIWDFSTDTVSSTDPIASAWGIIVDGTINAPAGEVEMLANNIANNVINITGLVNANAISPNTDGGEVILRTQQPAMGSVEIDGAGLGGVGRIEADGRGTGTGGTVVIETGEVRISGGGFIQVANDSGSPNGGTVSLVANVASGPTLLSSTGFIDPSSVGAITTVNLAYPSPVGYLYIFDDADHPGLDITGNYTFNTGTVVNLASQAGNITQASGSALNSDLCIYLTGNAVDVNGYILSLSGGVNLASRTGSINVGSTASIYSSSSSPISFIRSTTTGSLSVNSDGFISAGGGMTPLYIGNSPFSNYAQGSVTLTGSTFAGITGTYSADTDLNSGSSDLLASDVYVRVNSSPTPPTPPNPPGPTPTPDNHVITPEEEKDIQKEVESANSDLVDYGEKQEDYYNELDNGEEDVFDNDQLAALLGEDDNMNLGDADFAALALVCDGENCDEYVEESVGGAVFNTLIEGYPYENEFSADETGLLFAYEAGYSPHGLQGFLETVEYLENMAKVMAGGDTHSSSNNLFSYKHPPSSDRIAKVKSEIDTNNMVNKNKKVNKRRYKKMIKIVD